MELEERKLSVCLCYEPSLLYRVAASRTAEEPLTDVHYRALMNRKRSSTGNSLKKKKGSKQQRMPHNKRKRSETTSLRVNNSLQRQTLAM